MDSPPNNTNLNMDVVLHAALLAANHDRAAVGLPPLEYTEFAGIGNLLRGARRYWTPEKLAEKAKKQLRNPKTKRWVQQRGSLPGGKLNRQARARLGRTDVVDELNVRPPAAKTPAAGKFKLGPPPKTSPLAKVTRLDGGPATAEELKAAGHSGGRIRRWQDRGAVYRVEHPGKNPVHVFVASPDAMTEFRNVKQRQAHQQAKNTLANFDKRYARQLAAGDQWAKDQRTALLVDVAAAKADLDARNKVLQDFYGVGGSESLGRMEELLASEAGALFLRSIEDWSAADLKREDGKDKPFMLEFDESKMVRGDTGDTDMSADITKLVRGGRAWNQDVIVLNKRTFRDPMTVIPKGHVMPTELETWGQHTLAHEPGHLLDDREGEWDSARPDRMFDSFVAESRQFVDAKYVSAQPRPNREWYAEMHALSKRDQSSLTPEQRIAVMAYLSAFMLSRVNRPAAPSSAWVAENEQWLRDAKDALLAGEALPALPDPAEFFDIPKPKIQKKKSWGDALPW